MFEISVACKYLLPRWRQLSVSIISLISTFVIALVVWLIVVFFSVTDGLEKSWVQKLTALTAPLRIRPTDAYYNSYYYQVDSISQASDYSHKTIGEKREAELADPYDPLLDEEIPTSWPSRDLAVDGSLKDLVKLVYQSLEEISPSFSGLKGQDFELTMSHINLFLLRPTQGPQPAGFLTGMTRSVLSYPAFLGNFENDNIQLSRTLIPLRTQDFNNLLSLAGLSTAEEEQGDSPLPPDLLQKRLEEFFADVRVTQLKSSSYGWPIPKELLPSQASWKACFLIKGSSEIKRVVVPQQESSVGKLKKELEEQGFSVAIGSVILKQGELFAKIQGEQENLLSPRTLIILEGGVSFPAELDYASIKKAKRVQDLKFFVQPTIQHQTLTGMVSYKHLELGAIDLLRNEAGSPLWMHKKGQTFTLPKDPISGDGVLLPKSFKDGGVLVGDRGYLTYLSPTTSTLQEQHHPIYVAGFYDPGIIPIGGKFILANRDLVGLIRSAHHQEEKGATNGINVHFNDLAQTESVKNALTKAFKEHGIERYWSLETYREYEFTKEIMRELQSQKTIFSLIAIVIIIVACSNIISMLIILVNDKRVEIGILRSMGASSKSIALIFGLAGGVIGIIGSVVGIAAALLTLMNFETLAGWVSHFQGYDMLNTAFYGEALPHEISYNALSFVLIATVIISLLAGIVPAVKACLVRPSSILKSTGG